MAEPAVPLGRGQAPAGAPTTDTPTHDERLGVPLWWWVVGLAATSILAAEVHLGSPGVKAWLPYLLTVPLTMWALLHLGGLRVQVTGGELRVGQAHLPLAVISRVAEVPATAKRVALGRQLDPAAFVQHRSWVPTMVLVVLADPADPTPYWLVSTRRPAALLAALRAGGATQQR